MVRQLLVLFSTITLLYAETSGNIGIKSDYIYKNNSNKHTFSTLYSKLQYQTDVKEYEFNILARGYYSPEYPEYKKAWIDELTLSKNYNNYSFLVGKHQVNWGESDYYRVVNVINPIDFRDYYLSYLEDYKNANLSLWMIKGQYFADEWSSTLLIIPDFKETGLPQKETGFSNMQITGYEALPSKDPSTFTLQNSSVAMRVSSTIGESDVAAYAYYGWNHSPIVISSFQKQSFRRKMLGASLTKSVSDFVVRIETALYLNEVMQLKGYGGQKGDLIKTLVGLDWSSGNSTINVQLLNTYIYNSYSLNMVEEKNTNEASIYLEKMISNNNITFSNLLLNNFNTRVGLNELKLKYRYTDSLDFYIGCDTFWGKEGVLSGYTDQNRMFFNLKYFF